MRRHDKKRGAAILGRERELELPRSRCALPRCRRTLPGVARFEQERALVVDVLVIVAAEPEHEERLAIVGVVAMQPAGALAALHLADRGLLDLAGAESFPEGEVRGSDRWVVLAPLRDGAAVDLAATIGARVGTAACPMLL